MPIRIPDNLPAKEILEKEHIFVMGEKKSLSPRHTTFRNCYTEFNAIKRNNRNTTTASFRKYTITN